MPSMTAPFFRPPVTLTSMVFGDLDGSSFWVPPWITSSPFLTVYLSPAKVSVSPLNSSAGAFLPPASTEANVQTQWNFLNSFATSALSSARMAVSLEPMRPSVQHRVTSALRIPSLLDRYGTVMPPHPPRGFQVGQARAARSLRA